MTKPLIDRPDGEPPADLVVTDIVVTDIVVGEGPQAQHGSGRVIQPTPLV